tara:strand:+ start:730 stop:1245 length:516 start_codon:yes stop_codon:yes gene_type:complete
MKAIKKQNNSLTLLKRGGLRVGDIITDHDEGGHGKVTQVGTWVIIDWLNTGEYGVPYDMAINTILEGDWELEDVSIAKKLDLKIPSRLDFLKERNVMDNENVILYKSKHNPEVEVMVIYPEHESYDLIKENIFENNNVASIPEIKRIIIDGSQIKNKLHLKSLEKRECEKL